MAPRLPTNNGSYTDNNLNFIYGCRKVDAEGGCKHCYISRFWEHYKDQMHEVGATTAFDGKFIEFNEELRLSDCDSQPDNSVHFVNGLSDTFAEFVSDEQRNRWFGYLKDRPFFQFMLCTKRTGMMWLYFSKHKVPGNVWVGTSICRKKDLFRLPILKKIDAKVRWISFEPLLEDLGEVDLSGISFICLGGETEPRHNYRPFDVEWGKSMLLNARRSGTKFWYDGGNGTNDSRNGALYSEHYPDSGVLPQERFEDYPRYVGDSVALRRTLHKAFSFLRDNPTQQTLVGLSD
ncbi:MAG TPA: DUF5131 family protein [Candidatus Bathyarchaeia archaeon]|nr:DUF5131 family protein [Candidatus Bathyarchaeia archaeon]